MPRTKTHPPSRPVREGNRRTPPNPPRAILPQRSLYQATRRCCVTVWHGRKLNLLRVDRPPTVQTVARALGRRPSRRPPPPPNSQAASEYPSATHETSCPTTVRPIFQSTPCLFPVLALKSVKADLGLLRRRPVRLRPAHYHVLRGSRVNSPKNPLDRDSSRSRTPDRRRSRTQQEGRPERRVPRRDAVPRILRSRAVETVGEGQAVLTPSGAGVLRRPRRDSRRRRRPRDADRPRV